MSEGWPTSEELRALVEAEADRRGERRGSESWAMVADKIGEAVDEHRINAKGDPAKFRQSLRARYPESVVKAMGDHM